MVFALLALELRRLGITEYHLDLNSEDLSRVGVALVSCEVILLLVSFASHSIRKSLHS